MGGEDRILTRAVAECEGYHIVRITHNLMGDLSFVDPHNNRRYLLSEAFSRPGFVIYCFQGPGFDGWRHLPYVYVLRGPQSVLYSVTPDPGYTRFEATHIRLAKLEEVDGE